MKISIAELDHLKNVQKLLVEINAIIPAQQAPAKFDAVDKHSVLLKLKAVFETLKDNPMNRADNRISAAVQGQFPIIDWQQMRVMRNYLVHCYFLIADIDVLQLCQNFVFELKAQIDAVLACIKPNLDIDPRIQVIPNLSFAITGYPLYQTIYTHVNQSPLLQGNGASCQRGVLALAEEMLRCAQDIASFFAPGVEPSQSQKEAVQNCLEIYGEVSLAIFKLDQVPQGNAVCRSLIDITNHYPGINIILCQNYRSQSAHELALLKTRTLRHSWKSMSDPIFQAELEEKICQLKWHADPQDVAKKAAFDASAQKLVQLKQQKAEDEAAKAKRLAEEEAEKIAKKTKEDKDPPDNFGNKTFTKAIK